MADLSIIRDGSLLVGDDGLIEEVGTTRRIENLSKARNAFVVEAGGKVVLPGFVDCHTRPLFRSATVEEFESRIVGGLEPEEEPRQELYDAALDLHGVSPRMMQAALRRWFGGFVQCGTTTIDARCGLGLSARLDLKALRAVQAMGDRPLEASRTYSISGGGLDVAATKRNLEKLAVSGLAGAVELEHDPALTAPDQTEAVARAVRGQRVPLRVGCDQSARRGGVRFALEQGAFSIEHLVYANDVDIDALAASDAVAVVLPGASFHRGAARLAPARRLIDRGAVVALASGFGPRFSPPTTSVSVCAS